MTAFFGFLLMVCLSVTPILAIIFLVKWFKKKPKKKIGVATLISIIGIFAFTFLGVAFDPSTNCEHQYIIENKVEATCTDEGYTSHRCPKCDDVEKKDKVVVLGHDFKQTSIKEATEKTTGEIVYECSVCSEVKTEVLNKLQKEQSSSKDESTTSNIEESEKLSKNNTMGINGDKTDIEMIDIESDGITEKLISIGLTESEADEGTKILRQCGVPSIEICEATDPNATVDGLLAYRGKIDKDRIYMFTIENRKIFYVAFNGEDLYDEDKGGFLKNFDDVHIPETAMSANQKSELRDLSESALDSYFKFTPYYDAWGVARQDNNYMIQCEAYAKNDFGIKDWVRAKVWYEKTNDSYILTGVEIDGIPYAIK